MPKKTKLVFKNSRLYDDGAYRINNMNFHHVQFACRDELLLPLLLP